MQKLTNLEIEKVAFVPEGDNKGADVVLFKRKPPGSTTEEGEKKTTLKGLVSAFLKTLGFSMEDIEKSENEGTPEDGTGAGGVTKLPAGGTEVVAKNISIGEILPEKTMKGVDKDMKFDKSKLTPEELAQLEAIEKKAGIQETTNPTGDKDNGDFKKNNEPTNQPTASDDGNDDDIYKGLHPTVAAELKALRKRADEADEREMFNVAKKYEILGKKPEELAKTLKNLKAAGGSAYDDMIGVLDASLSTIEKSGMFCEIGKKGNGTQKNAWSQIEKHAETIQKSAPTLTWNQAVDKACEQHPELVAEYESGR